MRNFWQTKPELKEIGAWQPNCWVNVTCPDAGDLDYLSGVLHVPDYFLSDISDTDERPRIDTEDDWTLVILRIPYIREDDSKSPYTTIPLGIILNGEVCITVCYFRTSMMDDFRNYYARKGTGFTDAVDMVFKLFLSSSVWFLKLLKQINQQTEQAKQELDKNVANKDLIGLFHLQNCLTYFITSLKGNEILLSKLKFKLPIDELDADLIEDVEIELRQAHEMATIYSNILSGMMDTYASIINNNVSSTMKVLTSISIILMFPTLIASLYGMNVVNGLENAPYGFPILLVLSVAVSLSFLWLFRMKHWI